jgi:tetratricopeptide (TPR) repeat protein
VTTDREDALRRAESLLKQGQIDAAIAQYGRLVDAYPTDWTLLNTLGDLHVRAGAPERAVGLFGRIADAYLDEGFYARAAGFYKKVLKFAPADEDTLLKLARACGEQGLRADARTHMQAVVDARRRRGDVAGVAAVLCALDDLEVASFDGRLAAVRALVPLDPAAAVVRLRNIASDLDARGREADALAVWEEVRLLDPSDRIARARVARAALTSGDAPVAVTIMGIASDLEEAGDLEVLLEAQLRAGLPDLARETLLAWIRRDPDARQQLVSTARRVFSGDADTSYAWTERYVQAALSAGDAADALAALNDFVTHHPDRVDALLLAVEIANDAGLERDWSEAQAALAQAYMRRGEVPLARAIADELLARHPDHPLGRLTTGPLSDSSLDSAPAAMEARPLPVAEFIEATPVAVEPLLDDDPLFDAEVPIEEGPVPAEPILGHVPVDGPEPTAPPPPAVAERAHAPRVIEIEVDLTGRLELAADERAATLPEPRIEAAVPAPVPETDGAREALAGRADREEAPARSSLDEAFATLRDEAVEAGSDLLTLGRTYMAAGLVDQAIEAFVAAAGNPGQQYDASIALAEIFDGRHDEAGVRDWLFRAAAGAPSAAKRGAILYRLGLLLERLGDARRALAVFSELEALAPGFRDVSARVDRLSAATSGGGSSGR